MTTILAVLERSRKAIPRVPGTTPKLRVQCDTCGRVYITNRWPCEVRKQKGCAHCSHRFQSGDPFTIAMSNIGKGKRWRKDMANKNEIGNRRKRVWVPDDVREAVCAIYDAHVPGKGRLRHAGAVIGVAECTISELMSPGGAVQQKTLDRVVAKLAELGRLKVAS